MNIFPVWQGWTVSGPVKLHTNTVNACALQSFSLNPIYYLPESFIFISTLASWHFTTGLWIDHAYRTLQSNLTGTKMGVELPSFKCNIKSIAAVKEIERQRRSRENRMMKWILTVIGMKLLNAIYFIQYERLGHFTFQSCQVLTAAPNHSDPIISRKWGEDMT